jgi:hypothetical protein
VRSVGDEGLVRRNVGLDEAGEDELLRHVQDLVAGGVQGRGDTVDAAAADGDILSTPGD